MDFSLQQDDDHRSTRSTPRPAPGSTTTLDGPDEALLVRGRHALRLLEHRAQAAKLAAQVLQLRSAMNLAQQGQHGPLQQWLNDHDHDHDGNHDIDHGEVHVQRELLSHTPASTPAPCVDFAVNSGALTQSIGWDKYLFHAQRRLGQHAHESLPWHADTFDSSNLTSLIAHDSKSASDANPIRPPAIRDDATIGAALLDDALPQDTLPVDEPPREYLSIENLNAECSRADLLTPDSSHTIAADELTPPPAEQDAVDAQPLAALSTSDISFKGAATSKAQPKRTWGSLGFSLIGHSLLFLALGTITYRHQDQSAGLGMPVLDAVEVSHEVPELGNDLELSEPQAPDSSPALASVDTSPVDAALADIVPVSQTSSLNEVIGATSAAQSIAAAVGKSAGGHGATSTGSGSGKGGTGIHGGQFFGAGSGGNYFCYVVDSSGSMRGQAWESAKIELMRSLMTLKSSQQFYIVFFANEMHAIPEPGTRQPATHGLFATKENIDHARRWIETVQLSRGGPPTDALAWAIERQPDAIYLLTDGVTKVDVCGHVRKINLIDDIISGQQVRVPIHPIAYHSLDGQQLMRQLADENKGQFHYVPKPGKP